MSIINSTRLRPPKRYQIVGQTLGAYYSQHYVQYRPPALSRTMTLTYLHPSSESVFTTQVLKRPPTLYPWPRAPQTTNPFCVEVDMTVLPARYAFELSFLEAHEGWFVDSVSF